MRDSNWSKLNIFSCIPPITNLLSNTMQVVIQLCERKYNLFLVKIILHSVKPRMSLHRNQLIQRKSLGS